MKQAPARRKASRPNPQALAELQERFLWWLATRELKKRAELVKQPRRVHRIKV